MNCSSRTHPFAEVTVALWRRILYWKLQHFALRLSTQISPKTAPATKSDTSTSPNIAPATWNDTHDWYPSHMKRHLQCAEQQDSSSNVTKYCTCHAKWLWWVMSVTYETSFTLREATGVIHQPHQILRLPRKMAIQNLTEICRKQLKRHLQWRTIRAWSEHELVISHPPVRRGYFSRFGDAFCIENYKVSRSGYLPKFHQILCLPRKVTLQHHQILRLPRKMTLMIDVRHIWNVIYNARSSRTHPPTSASTAPATQYVSELLLLYWTVTLLNCYFTELLYLTELLLYWAVTWLNCHFTGAYWSCYLTELLLYWTVTWLNCYFTELLLSYYFTELLLDWTVTLLSCYFTELLLYWALCIFKSP